MSEIECEHESLSFTIGGPTCNNCLKVLPDGHKRIAEQKAKFANIIPSVPKSPMEKLLEITKVHCKEAKNSKYHWGLANGLLLAISIFTGEKPKYLKEHIQQRVQKDKDDIQQRVWVVEGDKEPVIDLS